MIADPTQRVVMTEQDTYAIGRVLELLGSPNALAGDIEIYVVGHHVLGRLAAVAQGEYEYAEQVRKTAYGNAWVKAKTDGPKVTDKTADTLAELEVSDLRHMEIQKKEKAARLRATLASVTEAINALKFLGRMAG